MKFTKMQGAGNDYVYVDVTKEPLENASEIAIKVSDRHFGIGSDGLILIAPSDRADFRMIMYNADGSQGAMCGNGVRCVGKYVYDHGLTDKTEITVETGSGIKYLTLYPEGGKVVKVRVDMGAPIFEAGKIPVDVRAIEPSDEEAACEADSRLESDDELIDVPIAVEGKAYRMAAVSMGNPHCVVFIDRDPRDYPVTEIGPSFETHPAFPDRVNTEFILVKDPHRLAMRVWERGSGETLACGTGACASAVAAIRNGLAESPVTVELLGGELEIAWDGEGSVSMTGPAVEVFEGEIDV